MNLKEKILNRTDEDRDASLFKTTSFTLFKADYEKFRDACKKAKRSPSVVLREMASIFIEESEAGHV